MTTPQQRQEWQALADAATSNEPEVSPSSGAGPLGYDTQVPHGIRYQFQERADAEFHSQAQGIVLALLAEVADLEATIATRSKLVENDELLLALCNLSASLETPDSPVPTLSIYEQAVLAAARAYREAMPDASRIFEEDETDALLDAACQPEDMP